MGGNDNYVSDGQMVALLVGQTTACLLSLLGSWSIIAIILRFKKWKQTRDNTGLYHRLLLGMSISDVISSTNFLISPYLQKADDDLLFASGNTASCSFTGFFLLSIISTTYYNLFLSFFYYKTIRCNVKELDLSRQYEKWMHVTAVLVPILYGIVCLCLKAFNNADNGLFCDISYYPTNCDHDGDLSDCTRGLYSTEIGLSSFCLFTLPALLGIGTTASVYWFVRKQTRQSTRHRFDVNVRDRKQEKRLKAMATQATLYVLAFANGFIWCLVLVIANSIVKLSRSQLGQPGWFALALIGSFMYALQGFLNFFIYIRPRYLQWRKRNLHYSRFWAVRQVMYSDDKPRTIRPSGFKTQDKTSDANGTPQATTYDAASGLTNIHTAELNMEDIAVEEISGACISVDPEQAVP